MIGLSILVVTFVVTMVFAQKAPPSCKGSPNNFPIITQPPKLMKTVKNGALYQVPIDKISTPLLIAHVYGTPYEMGFAQGKLLTEEIKYTTKGLYTLVNENIDQFIPHWPKSIQEIVNFLGDEALDIALDLEVEATRAYVKSYYTEEINGMADGSGLSRGEARRLQMFPELLKAHCSMFGAWGSATPNGDLIQLRALDWNTNTPFQQYPLLLVYHPSDPNSNTFATLTWPGLLGAITGLSAAPLGICEKVWLHFKGESTRFGEPFSFVLRDILQFDKTNEEAIHRIKTAHRTCSIFAGVGSKASGEFVAMEYSYPNVTVWSEKTQPVYKNHPLIKDVVYVDKHTQPDTHDPCMADLLSMYHGKLTPEITLKNITAQFQTGDMHIAIYDFAKMNLYIANASPYVNGKAIPAYDRPFVRLSATDLFNRKQ